MSEQTTEDQVAEATVEAVLPEDADNAEAPAVEAAE